MALNFSVWTDYFCDLSAEESIIRLQSKGFCRSELSINHTSQLLERDGSTEQKGSAFRTFIMDRGYTVSQGHLSFDHGLCSCSAIDRLKKEILGEYSSWKFKVQSEKGE